MSYEITSESYGRKLPKITATATSTDDLAALGTDWAEGSTCVISETTYKLDKVKGWVDPNSGGGGGGGSLVVNWDADSDTLDKSWQEIHDAMEAGQNVTVVGDESYESIGIAYGCAKTYDGTYQVYTFSWSGSKFSGEVFQASSATGTLERLGD